jgi:hypothetical protein
MLLTALLTKHWPKAVDPLTLINDYMVPAMDEVGCRFECSEFFVPELLIAARAMKAALELIRPLLTARGDQPVGAAPWFLHRLAPAASCCSAAMSHHNKCVTVLPSRPRLWPPREQMRS